jgi:ribosomal protein L16 Arg81 hydroxylase
MQAELKTCTATLFSSIDENFADSYWPDSLCYAHQDASEIRSLLQADRIDDHLKLMQICGKARSHTKRPDGSILHKRMNLPEALAAYAAGNTLIFDEFEKSFPPIAQVVELLARELFTPKAMVSCTAFASPQGEGVPLHFDAKEVIAVQLSGRKTWYLAPNDVDYPLSDYLPLDESSLPEELESYLPAGYRHRPEPAQEFTLRPGDTLFVPRGYWHSTRAPEASISLSFIFSSPTHLQILLNRYKKALIADPNWRTPAAVPCRDAEWMEKSRAVLEQLSSEYLARSSEIDRQFPVKGYRKVEFQKNGT